MNILTVAEMQSIEKTANASGITYETMMQHAGCGMAQWVMRNLDTTQGVIGLIGSGNNGGDTLIALTELSKCGLRTQAFLARPREDDRLIETYLQTGGSIIDVSDNNNIEYLTAGLFPGSILLDGILGTGFKLPLRGDLEQVMRSICSAVNAKRNIQVVAVDCPSGIECDTGEVSKATLKASHTLTMAAVKQGLLHQPARAYCGEFHLVDIGIGDLENYLEDALSVMLDAPWVRSHLPERPETGHKGTFGTCLVLAGSKAFTGAAYLAGKAAYRSGCGLVNVATLESVRNCLAGELVEAVWTTLPEREQGYDPKGVAVIEKTLASVDSLVIGPGLGNNSSNLAFMSDLLEIIPNEMPTLIDADGLKLLSQIDHWWEKVSTRTILTPHPGELSVLTGKSINDIQSDRWEIAKEYAKRWGVVLLLKGAVTVISDPAGNLFIDPTSDTALATAGSGDVLSGLIGGLLAQGLDQVNATSVGVWLHGNAGLCAKEMLGTSIPVTAMDILNGIKCSFVKLKEAG